MLVVPVHAVGRGASSGVEIDTVFGWLYEWRDGRATRFHVYPTVGDATEAAGRLAGEDDMSERLFETGGEARRTGVPLGETPLATRMRPRYLDEFAGQSHLLGEGSALRVAIESGEPHSAIFYGPPGTGKTTLAPDHRGADRGRLRGALRRQRRAGRGQGGDRPRGGAPRLGAADDLLPRRDPPLQQGSAGRPPPGRGGGADHADRGDDREPLLRGQLGPAVPDSDLRVPAARRRRDRGPAAARADRRTRAPGLPADPGRGTSDAGGPGQRRCARRPGGAGARTETTAAAGESEVSIAAVEDALQRKALLYDRQGDKHYDYISAWIKATRGSDVDASMLPPGGDAGGRRGSPLHRSADGDLRFGGHRQCRSAGPRDRQRRRAGGADRVGLPECALNLAQATAYLALAPSKTPPPAQSPGPGLTSASTAPQSRRRTCRTPTTRAPASSAGARATDTRMTSRTPSPTSRSAPESVRGERFYEPTDRGFEAEALRERLERLRKPLGGRDQR